MPDRVHGRFQDNEGYASSPIYGYNSMRNEWNDVILPAVPSEQFTHRMAYNIRGLDTASEYEAKVMAKNRFGWTPMSDVFKFVTSATPEAGKNKRFRERPPQYDYCCVRFV